MEKLPVKEMVALVPVGEASPIGFANVFEHGDLCFKTQECDGCGDRREGNCCGNCPLVMADGRCQLHAFDGDMKPFHCVVKPTPDRTHSYCSLEFLFVAGKNKNKIRRVRDRGDVFVDGGG